MTERIIPHRIIEQRPLPETGVPHHIFEMYPSVTGLGGAWGSWGDRILAEEIDGIVRRLRGNGLGLNPDLYVDPKKIAEDYGIRSRFVHFDDPSRQLDAELEFGSELVRRAAGSTGFELLSIDALVYTSAAPATHNFASLLATNSGLRPDVIKQSYHVACAGGPWALGEILMDDDLKGKRVMLVGMEGFGRLFSQVNDDAALQLFGNGGAAMGFIPGETILPVGVRLDPVGDKYQSMGLRMDYPYAAPEGELIYRNQDPALGKIVSGRMIVPRDGGAAQIHNGGEMLRLFLHETPRQLSLIYQELGISPDMTRIHHMNKSIMQKMDRQMIRDGLPFQLEWMFSEYGNISAASALMHLVRSELKQGDIIALHGLAIGGFYATDFFRIGPKDLRFRERDGRRPLYLDGWESKQALYRLSEDGKTAIFL